MIVLSPLKSVNLLESKIYFVVCNHRYSGVMRILMPIGSVGDICGADFAGSNDSMEMYPAILMHILD